MVAVSVERASELRQLDFKQAGESVKPINACKRQEGKAGQNAHSAENSKDCPRVCFSRGHVAIPAAALSPTKRTEPSRETVDGVQRSG